MTTESIEEARVVAFNAYFDGMHFHEVAMRDPFAAEREYQALAHKITELLGLPWESVSCDRTPL